MRFVTSQIQPGLQPRNPKLWGCHAYKLYEGYKRSKTCTVIPLVWREAVLRVFDLYDSEPAIQELMAHHRHHVVGALRNNNKYMSRTHAMICAMQQTFTCEDFAGGRQAWGPSH